MAQMRPLAMSPLPPLLEYGRTVRCTVFWISMSTGGFFVKLALTEPAWIIEAHGPVCRGLAPPRRSVEAGPFACVMWSRRWRQFLSDAEAFLNRRD
jgi:hypothetical protein